jgi:hypothetical protein
MSKEDEHPLGRRDIDQYGTPSPEVLHVLLLGVKDSLIDLKVSVEKGFTELKVQFDHVEKRVTRLRGSVSAWRNATGPSRRLRAT